MASKRTQMPQLLILLLLGTSCIALTSADRLSNSRSLLQQDLEAYSQCGGLRNENCGPSARFECMDKVYPTVRCPKGFSCQRKNKNFWQCLPNSAAGDLSKAKRPKGSTLRAPRDVRLEPWQQCGGIGSECRRYECVDAAFPGYKCSSGFKCVRQDQWYWQCVADSSSTPEPEPTPDPTPAPAPEPAPPAPEPPAGTLPLTGTNSYYLLTWSADPSRRAAVRDTLDGAVKFGFKVIRIWAFADGPGENYLQPRPGVLDSTVLSGLDWLMDEAEKRGLKFMMTLTNSWPDYGGMRQYVRWARGLPDNAQVSNRDFYFNGEAQDLFRSFARSIVTRYRSHKAVHSWDLCNQPRADGDKTGAIAKWISATAKFVKSLDSRHPVTVGLDGFFGPSTPELQFANPYDQDSGNDFVEECKSLDFCCFHMYPDLWRSRDIPAREQADWAEQWVTSHNTASERYLGGMKVVLSEYNILPAGTTRETLFQRMSDVLLRSIRNKEPFSGAMVWMLSSRDYPYNDGYNLYTDEDSRAADIQKAMNKAVMAAA